MHKKNFLQIAPLGVAVGFLAGLFGAGGGMLAVPALRRLGLKEDRAHATSLAVMLPLAVLSGLLYLHKESFKLAEAMVYWPGGIAGAITGALLFPKIKAKWLRRLFSVIVLGSGIRLLLR